MDDKPAVVAAKMEYPDELYEAYANNVVYESSVWDLKFIFAQLDQSTGTAKVVAHSAITVPWPQVKLMLYWLRLQVEVQEKTNGRIVIPAGVSLPPHHR